MDVEFYLPYSDYNDDSFSVSENTFKDESEYIKAITDDFDKHKNIDYELEINAKNTHRDDFLGTDGQFYSLTKKMHQNANKVAYSKCNGTLFNSNGENDTVDELIEKFAKQEQFVEMVELKLDSIEEEFETDFLMYLKEHKEIDSYSLSMGEEWSWNHEPKRDIRIVFKNKANQNVYAVLENCKVMDIVDDKTFILFVDKMTLVDKFI